MTEITFELLPQAVTKLFSKVENIERLLLEKSNEPQPETDKWFDILELCDYLPNKPARATIYGLVHNRKIPFHKTSKSLIFRKSEIDDWLRLGRIKTIDEIQVEATNYLKGRG
jgi:excisionase family DNA binding protein